MRARSGTLSAAVCFSVLISSIPNAFATSVYDIQVSGASSIATATCTPYTISLIVAKTGKPKVTSSGYKFLLSGAGSGAFYGSSDSGCASAPVTQVVYPAGVTDLVVYFKDPSAESLGLTVSAPVFRLLLPVPKRSRSTLRNRKLRSFLSWEWCPIPSLEAASAGYRLPSRTPLERRSRVRRLR